MARRIDLTDWHIQVGESAVLARPSGTVIGRQLWLSLLCVVFMALIAWSFGLPPGSRKVASLRDRIERTERQAERHEQQARRLRSGVGDTTKQMAERYERDAAQTRLDLAALREELSEIRPTLGPVKDLVYWHAMGLLALVAVGVPFSGRFERVTMIVADDELRIRTFLSLNRGGTFRLRDFTAVAVHAQRVVVRERRYGQTVDGGWLWSIHAGDPAQPAAPALDIRVESNDVLPPRIEQMTGPTRDLVRFFQRHTHAVVADTVTTDVSDIDAHRIRLKSRRHAPPR